MSVSSSQALEDLTRYCRRHQWKGRDCFDSLNSPWSRSTPLYRSPLARTLWTQAFKRSPVSLWRLGRVPVEENPKALALFLLGMTELERAKPDAERRADIGRVASRLLQIRLPAQRGGGWGYPFDWQSRAFFAPRGTPNIVTTTFACRALLRVYRLLSFPDMLDAAEEGCRFVAEDLAMESGQTAPYFAYIPGDRSRIYNATLLGSRLLAEAGAALKHPRWGDLAFRAARGVVEDQAQDGSWPYGPGSRHRWIDSFHTGYNLVALEAVARCLECSEFDEAIARGYRFYRERFFGDDLAPRYYSERTYPIDIHSAAVAIETFLAMRRFDPSAPRHAAGVARWTIRNMRDHHEGCFYFQKHRIYVIRTPYMRWSQAWMFYALALLESARGRAPLAQDAGAGRTFAGAAARGASNDA